MNVPTKVLVQEEGTLVKMLAAALVEQGFRVRTEVSNMGQSADLVATRGRWVTVIEAKLGHWRRALTQCRAHEHVADYICIALASVSLPKELRETAEKLGYGVIHFKQGTGTFDWALKPRMNKAVWRPQRKYWANKVRKHTNAN